MNFFYIILVLLLNLSFSQSLLNRFIVPLYIESEISYGFDSNFLKLSQREKNDNHINNIMGDSKRFSSSIFKNKINIRYIPYIFHDHETRFDFRVSVSNYKESELKSYNSYYVKFSQHLGPYTWMKFSYSYTPSFYIKSYYKSDPYIVLSESMGINSEDYIASLFSSEKVGFEVTSPVPYLFNNLYFSGRYSFEWQYYNKEFSDFNLEIGNYYFKLRKRFSRNMNFSLGYMFSQGNNISYITGGQSSMYKDRSYEQNKIYIALSMNTFYLLGLKNSMGLLSTIEQRSFSSNIKTDLFHFSRTHNDISYSYWFKSYISNYFGIKFKGVYRYRDTLSDSQYVQELKSFEKFEIWLSVILKMDLNVY